MSLQASFAVVDGDSDAYGLASNFPILQVARNTVARTDTTDKVLFTLPANAVVVAIFVNSPAASDAGTTAILDIGKVGTLEHFIANFDIKTAATGAGSNLIDAITLGSVGSTAIQVTGKYAETGGASTTGGPWSVVFLFYVL
jgi:hypothetical protein